MKQMVGFIFIICSIPILLLLGNSLITEVFES